MIKEDYYRTYISLAKHPERGLLVYGGLHRSTYANPFEDHYKGSGVRVKSFIDKYGSDLVHVMWVGTHETEDEMREAEIDLIAALRRNHNKACINLTKGGEVYKPRTTPLTDEEKEMFSKVVSTSKRALTPHWKHYNELFKLWVDLGMCGEKKFRIEAVKASYPDTTYKTMVNQFRKDIGEGYPRLLTASEQENLYEVWIKNGKAGHITFNRIAKSLGYPNQNYDRLINKFYKNSGEPRKGYQRGLHWDSKETLYQLWLKHNKPKPPTFSKIAISLGFPKTTYKTMVSHFYLQDKGVDNECSLCLEVLEPIRN